MPIPSRPIPTPAQRQRPGTSVSRKHLPHRFSPASERAEMAHHLPLSLGVRLPVRPSSAGGGGGGEELKRVMSVDLGDLIDASRGKVRAPRASTAATLGFQLVAPMPSVLSLPDMPFLQQATAIKTPSHNLQLGTPSTPALIADDEADDDDEWEHVGLLEEDGDGELVVVGELELDLEPAKGAAKAKQTKASYAAVAVSNPAPAS